MITSRCTECGATSLDGVLIHVSGCQDLEEPVIGIQGQKLDTQALLKRVNKIFRRTQ